MSDVQTKIAGALREYLAAKSSCDRAWTEFMALIPPDAVVLHRQVMNDVQQELVGGVMLSFQKLAEYDWLETEHSTTLHALADGVIDPVNWCVDKVTFKCGRRVARAFIPGLFSRMSDQRCRQCCKATGMPQGKGSPKNDETCRKVMGI